MKAFSIDTFVEAARAAAAERDAPEAMQELMHAVFADVDLVDRNMPEYQEEEALLFEDDSVSIWYCRFAPGLHVPPHEHRMNAYIGVYRGAEDNLFYRREGGSLNHINTRTARRGDVVAMGRSAIHSVENRADVASHGLHVYLGPLSQVERDLFDVEQGCALAFTEENYNRLKSFAD